MDRHQPEASAHVLVWGRVVIDLVTDRLVIKGEERRVGPTPLRLLKYMILHAGRDIPRDELHREVLRSHHAPDSSVLRNHLAELRVALGPDAALVRRTPAGWGIASPDASVGKT